MGVYNREYMRDPFARGGGGAGPRSWSLVTWLVVINVAVYLGELVLFDQEHIGYVTRAEVLQGHVYLLITYMFVHGHPMHLLLNMVMLWFAGKALLQLTSRGQFLWIYFGGGVLGALAQMALFPEPILGASAGVMAVFVALAALLPNQEVYFLLFFVIPIRARLKTMALVLVAMDLALFLGDQMFGWNSEIGHLAHLGGAFFGWFFISVIAPWQQSRNTDSARKDRWRKRFGARRVLDAETGSAEKKGSERGGGIFIRRVDNTPEKPGKPFVSADVDAILDKISEQGMQSLTDEERKILERSSRKLARRVDGK